LHACRLLEVKKVAHCKLAKRACRFKHKYVFCVCKLFGLAHVLVHGSNLLDTKGFDMLVKLLVDFTSVSVEKVELQHAFRIVNFLCG